MILNFSDECISLWLHSLSPETSQRWEVYQLLPMTSNIASCHQYYRIEMSVFIRDVTKLPSEDASTPAIRWRSC